MLGVNSNQNAENMSRYRTTQNLEGAYSVIVLLEGRVFFRPFPHGSFVHNRPSPRELLLVFHMGLNYLPSTSIMAGKIPWGSI